MSSFRTGLMSLITLAGGVSLAAIPPATLAISSRIFSTIEQGYVSVAIMAATFVGQLVFAAIVESRLSSTMTERRVIFPRWLTWLTLVATIAVIALPESAVVICLALPVLLASLEVGRGVSVAERLDSREMIAAACVGAGALAGVVLAVLDVRWALIPLAAGVAVATAVRSLRAHLSVESPDPSVRRWVVGDVAITGFIYPSLNALILISLGPVSSVLFASISTVSGLLAIPLNFMRLRLLKAHSAVDVWLSASVLAIAVLVIGVLEATGILARFFDSSWTLELTVLPLAVACAWRAASLATTLPFAALRRSGHAKLLTVLRAACAVVTFAAGASVLPLNSITVVFLIMLGGEVLQAIVYQIARRRVEAESLTRQ